MTDHPMHDMAIDGAVGPPKPDNARRGFPGLFCINCGEEDTVRVKLEDCTFECVSCDAEYDADRVRRTLAGWAAVLRWVALAPAVPAPTTEAPDAP